MWPLAETKSKVFVREATGLVRQLSTRDVLMFNLLNMGLIWPFLYIFFAGATYQGVYTPITVLVALPLNLIIATLYYYLSTAFPRTGGDYIYNSRIIHPAIGFMTNFAFTAFFLGALGFVFPWFTLYGLNTLFVNLSVVTGNSGWLALASQVTTKNSILIGDLILMGSVIIATVAGLRATFRYQWGTFVIVLLGAVVFAAAFLSSSPDAFKANFNANSGANYDSIIGAANGAGFITGFTFMGTLFGSFFSFLNYLGYSFSTYLGGEVKQSQKAQFYAIIVGTLIFAGVTFVMFALPWFVAGGSFINAASLLSGSGNAAYTLPSPPLASFLVVFANSNPIVAILVPLGLIAAVFGASETVIIASVRNVFAWAFDGVIPTKFSEVNEKRGSPNYAVALVIGITLIYVLTTLYVSNILTVLAYSTSGIYIAISITGLAGILLPYRRKDLFAQAPPSVKRMIGGVPVISLLGVGTLLTGAFVGITAASPAYTGSPINPVYISVIGLTFLVGLLVYVVSYYYHKSKGLDITLRFKEIPPE